MGSADSLQDISDAIDGLLTVDHGLLTDAELHEAVVGLHREAARLGAAIARLTSPWELRQVWAGDGSKSAAARLGRETRCAKSSAQRSLRRARNLASMPHTRAAIVEGRLSLDHADLLGKLNRPWPTVHFADHEEMLVEQCAQLNFDDGKRAVDYWRLRADADGAADDMEHREQAAHLHATTMWNGDVVINGQLNPVRGAIVTEELDRLEHLLYLDDQRDGIVRTASQRRAAALVEMATRSAATTDERRPRPLFTVLVGDRTLERLCELENGTVIPPESLVKHLTEADIESIIFDGPTIVLGVSHRRTFIGALRRAIQVRDRRCQHPSDCDVRANRCDVDHIVPHVEHGPTSQFNGRLECPTHNRHTDRHDHGARPLPARRIDKLDILRARIRWRIQREDSDDGDDLPQTG